MRILFLTHFFPPEVGAPQTRILETAQGLQARGHEVMVLTGFPNYPSGVVPRAYRGRLWLREEVEGVPVLRTWLYPAPNRGFARRVLCHVSFAGTALAGAAFLPWRPQVICVDMHPIFLCVTAYVLSRRWRVPYVITAGDLIPDQAVAYGAMRDGTAARITRSLADFVCARAAAVVALTEGIAAGLLERGIPQKKVQLIYYGADIGIFQNEPPKPLQPNLEAQLTGKFVVTYAGSHGMPHGLETVLEAAEFLQDEPDIHFLFVGDGSKKQALIEIAQARELRNVTFANAVPRDMMPTVYSRSDVCLVPLRKSSWVRTSTLSCKVFDVMAAARPVVVAAEGETSRFVQVANAGLCVVPEAPQELARAVLALRDDPEMRRRCGENGQRFIEENLSRERQTQRFEAVLRRAIGHNSICAGKGHEDRDVTRDEWEHERNLGIYRHYENDPGEIAKRDPLNPGNIMMKAEKEKAIRVILANAGREFICSRAQVLDVGCGSGAFLGWLLAYGVKPGNLWGIDLLEDRIVGARGRLPGVHLRAADARKLPFRDGFFDLAVCHLVFGSILEDRMAEAAGKEILRVLSPKGMILWYENRYPTPGNPHVRGYTLKQLHRIFPNCRLKLETITLLPPLARRLGKLTPALYPGLVRIAPLRARYLGTISKIGSEVSNVAIERNCVLRGDGRGDWGC
jgi:glycosyltransferase involved in cell wall biosynthesis